MPSRKKPVSCACNSGLIYRDCCRLLHRGEIKAATAEQLMRSRYSAFERRLYAYIHNSWAASTRPDLSSLQLTAGANTQWLGLDILALVAGQPGDLTGIVEFNANYSENGTKSVLYERSHFVYEDDTWFYLKAE